jgi:hypothetical protein
MSNDLLVSLRRYVPSTTKDPLENFITEAFAWILKNEMDLCKFFIKKISENAISLNNNINNITCETQVNYDGFYPDMVISVDNHLFVFEHKVWSDLHYNQIENYKNFANRINKNNCIVLVTANVAQHTCEISDINLCWENIYIIIQEWLSANNTKNENIINSFLNLLKAEGIGLSKPINCSKISFFNLAKNLDSDIKDFIKKIEITRKKELNDLLLDKYSIESKWGRFGFGFMGRWNPGLFIGFLLFEKDHAVPPLAGSKSPDFSLIFSFDNQFHNIYPFSQTYLKLKKDINYILKTTTNKWDLYDIAENGKGQNSWHPLHIRLPMINLFKDTTNVNEQINQFFKYSQDIIPPIINLDSFKELKKELI